MFEKAPIAEQTATPEVHEMRVAVFDLSQKALASASFAAPSLIIDQQPLGDNGLPGITGEARAQRVGPRNKLSIPAVDVVGRVHSPDSDQTAYVVTTREPINFRHFNVRRFEIDHVLDIATRTVYGNHETGMTMTDAQLILSGLALREMRRLIPLRYTVG